MNYVLDTKRLFLRELTGDDAVSAYHLNLDPEVVRYTGDVPFVSIEEAAEFLKNYTSYRDYGFGRWGVFLKETEGFMGWCGLKYSPELKEYDLGFRLMKKYWNKGYATEAGLACLKYGFNQFNIPEILGRVRPENIASVRALEKCGMNFIQSIMDLDGPNLIYKITRQEFESSPSI